MSRLRDVRTFVENDLRSSCSADVFERALVHLNCVSLACALLAKKRNISWELACVAAMLHDIAAYKSGSYEDHAAKSAVLARTILEQMPSFSPKECDAICLAIANHDSKDQKDAPLDEVLKDADVIHHTFHDLGKAIKEKEMARYTKIREEFAIM